MKAMEVHQVLPALDVFDAVSNDTLEIKKILEKNGHVSKIFSLYSSPKLAAMREPIEHLSRHAGKEAIILYHYSIKSEISDILKRFPNNKILIYHNITPPHFFKGYDEELYWLCRNGIDALSEIKDDFQLALGDSEFNRAELEQIGFNKTDVLPIYVDLKKYERYNVGLFNRLMSESNVNIIFVGRITPNKRQDDAIKAFYYYHKYINPNSKLYIIGKGQMVRYVQELKAMIGILGLRDSIVLTGSISEKDMASYYKAADLFLCMSEHEGFCVPLLEAMNFDVPIMAYKSTGVPYTMADAGILFNKKNYIQIAEMIDALISDRDFKEKVVKKQRSRLQDFSEEKVESKLIEVIRELNGVNIDGLSTRIDHSMYV